MKPRIFSAWVLPSAWIVSILVHVSVLFTVGAMTLAGGRPAKPGVSEIAINLSAPPAPKAAAPAPQPKAQPAPQPKPKPKPKAKPKPKPKPVAKPKPKPEPKPEPTPEPQVAETKPTETPDESVNEEASTQPLTQGAKGMAGDPGKGVHQSGDTENALNKYLAKVRDTIDYNKQYPHRAKMRRQQGTVKVSFVINASGRAEQVEITESSGSRILDRATKELVSRLRFDAPPKELDSSSVPVHVIAPVDYDLSNS
ncbi:MULTISPECIES: energy transducer TonB [unclassified Alcanivorax]|jgi:protein TonB|uniref:energy transducer TonB n=1 Tax=unclassified Alcanivorax TaxID=2638842 RepID=UPI00017ED692|nr:MULTISPECIES: energy transducer TonB [unclassified Alcanivorax]EDX89499.1 TonB family C-terminal domain protein [Alcanivorax sp. DG881]